MIKNEKINELLDELEKLLGFPVESFSIEYIDDEKKIELFPDPNQRRVLCCDEKGRIIGRYFLPCPDKSNPCGG